MLTRGAFLEMIELEKRINAVTEYSDTTVDQEENVTRPKKGTEVSLIDVCDVQYITPQTGSAIPKVRVKNFVFTAANHEYFYFDSVPKQRSAN